MSTHSSLRRMLVPLLVALVAAHFASAASAAGKAAKKTRSTDPGLWLVTDQGAAKSLGPARVFTRAGKLRKNPVVAATATPTGGGLWAIAANGRVLRFGDAAKFGFEKRAAPARAAAIASTPDGGGYFVVFGDGLVQAFGDAVSYGSATVPDGAAHAIVGIALTPTGDGYWLVGADGHVYAFGDADLGVPAWTDLGDDVPVVAVASTPTGRGLWLADANGRVAAIGDAASFDGESDPHGAPGALAGIAATPSGQGLWLADADGTVTALGDAAPLGPAAVTAGSVVAVASSIPMSTLTVNVTDLPDGVTGSAHVAGANGSFDVTQTETLRVAAGDYDVTADSVHVLDSTYVPTIDTSPVSAGAGATASVTVDYATDIPDTTKPVESDAVEDVTGDPAVGQTVTLDSSTAPDLAVGDTIALGVTPATPDGLLGKVTAIDDLGASLVVQTTPTTLMDAVPSGDIDVDVTIGANGTGTVTGNDSAGGGGTVASPMAHNSSSTVTTKILQSVDCGADPPVSVKGTISLLPSLKFSANWGGWRHPLSQKVDFEGSVTETATLALAAKAAVHCEVHDVPLLAEPFKFKFAIKLYDIVIPTEGEVQLYLNADGRIGASVDASVNESITATAGAEEENGEVTPIAEVTHAFDGVASSPQASASFSATVGPELSILFYNFGGPEVSVDSGFAFDADVLTEPPTPWWTLYATLEAGAGLVAPDFGLDWEKRDVFKDQFLLAQATEPPPPQVELSVNPESVTAGTNVSVSGSGYGAAEKVALTLDSGGSSLGSATTDASGDFTATVHIPASTAEGEYDVVGTGHTSGARASAPLDVEAAPGGVLTVDPSTAMAGQSVTVDGSGFGAKEMVKLAFEDRESLGTVKTDASGSFSKSVTIPDDADIGDDWIGATGKTSGKYGSGDIEVIPPPPPTITVDPPYGKPGDTVTVSGSNFGKSEIVDVTFDDGSTLDSPTTDSSGSFSDEVTIPANAADGDHVIDALGRRTGDDATSTVYVSETGQGPPTGKSFHLSLETDQGLITEAPCGTDCSVTLYADYGDGNGFVPVEGTYYQVGTGQTVTTTACPAYDTTGTGLYGPQCSYDVEDAVAFQLTATAPVFWDGGKDLPNLCAEPQLGTVCTVNDIESTNYRFTAYTPAGYWGDPPDEVSPGQLSGESYSTNCGQDCDLGSPIWQATVGDTLSATPGAWTGASAITIQWIRCFSNLTGCQVVGTGTSYTVTAADCPGLAQNYKGCGTQLYAETDASNPHGEVSDYVYADVSSSAIFLTLFSGL